MLVRFIYHLLLHYFIYASLFGCFFFFLFKSVEAGRLGAPIGADEYV